MSTPEEIKSQWQQSIDKGNHAAETPTFVDPVIPQAVPGGKIPVTNKWALSMAKHIQGFDPADSSTLAAWIKDKIK